MTIKKAVRLYAAATRFSIDQIRHDLAQHGNRVKVYNSFQYLEQDLPRLVGEDVTVVLAERNLLPGFIPGCVFLDHPEPKFDNGEWVHVARKLDYTRMSFRGRFYCPSVYGLWRMETCTKTGSPLLLLLASLPKLTRAQRGKLFNSTLDLIQGRITSEDLLRALRKLPPSVSEYVEYAVMALERKDTR